MIQLSSILMYILPLSLLTGPFISDLSISIVSLIFLYLSISKKEWFYYTNIFSVTFFIFCLYIILRSLLSSDVLLSLESSLFYFRFGLFALAVWYLINNNNYFLKKFTLFILIIFVYALIDGIYQYFNTENLFGIESNKVRMNLSFSDELILGGYLARMFPLLLALVILNYHIKNYMIYFVAVLLIVTDVMIYITGERSAIFLLTFATCYIILLIDRYKKLRIITFIISMLIIFLITIFNQNIRERNIDYTLEQMSSSNKEIPGNEIENHLIDASENEKDEIIFFSKEHNAYIRTSLNMFSDNIIFGQGPKMFRKNCQEEKFAYNKSSCSTHPHHTYFQLLGETGLIGFLFSIIFIFVVLFLSAKHLFLKYFRNTLYLNDYQICLLACFIIFLNPFTPSLNFFNNWISILHFLPIGFYLQSIYGNNSKKETEK